jgi:hypothetical protein
MDAHEVALLVDCPFCKAAHGAPCRPWNGYGEKPYARRRVHRDRVDEGRRNGTWLALAREMASPVYQRAYRSGFEDGFADGFQKAMATVKETIDVAQLNGDRWLLAREAARAVQVDDDGPPGRASVIPLPRQP